MSVRMRSMPTRNFAVPRTGYIVSIVHKTDDHEKLCISLLVKYCKRNHQFLQRRRIERDQANYYGGPELAKDYS